MSESETTSTAADLEALEALQADASELERIEELLDRFNVFETIGFISDERMHSNFLAFLLNPRRNDGLKDLLIKGVLRETLSIAHKTLPPSVFKNLNRVIEDLDGMDLTQTLVRREHHDIDILLTNEDHKLAVIIENKIWAAEGPGQLEKYYSYVKHTYRNWDVHSLYLTPSGVAPSHKAYVPIAYGTVFEILDGILEERDSSLESDVKMSIEHYMGMVRRQILGDLEIVRTCHEMYQKHKRAFDLIIEHRPDPSTV